MKITKLNYPRKLKIMLTGLIMVGLGMGMIIPLNNNIALAKREINEQKTIKTVNPTTLSKINWSAQISIIKANIKDKSVAEKQLLHAEWMSKIIHPMNLEILALKRLLNPALSKKKSFGLVFEASTKLQQLVRDLKTKKMTQSELITRKTYLENEMRHLMKVAHIFLE